MHAVTGGSESEEPCRIPCLRRTHERGQCPTAGEAIPRAGNDAPFASCPELRSRDIAHGPSASRVRLCSLG